MMLTIVFAIEKLVKWKEKFKYIMPILTVIFLVFFIYFYPVYSGAPGDMEKIQSTEWFNTWEY